MKNGLIYIATSKTSGKSYIGQTVDYKKRIIRHKSDAFNKKSSGYNSHFHNAIRKYSWNDFKWEILHDNVPNELLNDFEKSTILKYNTYSPDGNSGYNSTPGGDHDTIMSDVVIQKISIACKGKKKSIRTDEHCKKISFNQTGKQHTTETKNKLSLMNTGKKYPDRQNKPYKNNKWEIINPLGLTIIVSSILQYCKDNDLDPSCMYKVARGDRKQLKGYKCKKLQ